MQAVIDGSHDLQPDSLPPAAPHFGFGTETAASFALSACALDASVPSMAVDKIVGTIGMVQNRL